MWRCYSCYSLLFYRQTYSQKSQQVYKRNKRSAWGAGRLKCFIFTFCYRVGEMKQFICFMIQILETYPSHPFWSALMSLITISAVFPHRSKIVEIGKNLSKFVGDKIKIGQNQLNLICWLFLPNKSLLLQKSCFHSKIMGKICNKGAKSLGK